MAAEASVNLDAMMSMATCFQFGHFFVPQIQKILTISEHHFYASFAEGFQCWNNGIEEELSNLT